MSEKLKTDQVPDHSPAAGGDFIRPVLQPGNHKIKLLEVYLQIDKDPYKRTEFGDRLMLKVEGEPLPEPFKGLPIDKNDPSKGFYNGQIAMVGYQRWGFKDFLTKTDIQIDRATELMIVIKNICKELGLTDWWKGTNNRFDNVEQLIAAFNNEKPFKDIYFYACISGKEYMNGSYVNYELYLPREDRERGKPFSLNVEKVMTFFESINVDKLKKTEASSSKTTQTELPINNAPKEEVRHSQTEPSKPTHMSQQEQDFYNAGKQQNSSTPITDSFLKEADDQKSVLDDKKALENPYNPWEPEYETWEKEHGK